MTDYDVFEVNQILQDYVFHLKSIYGDGKNMTPEKKMVIDALTNAMLFEALSIKPCCLDDVLFLLYKWNKSGVSKRTTKFIMTIVAEVIKLNEDSK